MTKANQTSVTLATVIILFALGCHYKDAPASNENAGTQKIDSLSPWRKSAEITCECLSKHRVSTLTFSIYDSCVKLTLQNQYTNFKRIGLDIESSSTRIKVSDQILNELILDCKHVGDFIIQKDFSKAEYLNFHGSLISQQKLPTGGFEIKIRDQAGRIVTFHGFFEIDTFLLPNSVSPGLSIQYLVKREKNRELMLVIPMDALIIPDGVTKVQN